MSTQERDGIPEWTPKIGIQCAILDLRENAIRLRDGSYSPQTIADDSEVIVNDLSKCFPVAQQEQPAQEPVAFITTLMEQQMFDDWCPYKGSPDPRVVWAAAIDAANGLLLQPPTQPALTQEQAEKLAHRRATTYTHRSDPNFTAYAFTPLHLMDFVRDIEAHCRGGAK